MSDNPNQPAPAAAPPRPGYDLEIGGVRHRVSDPVKGEHGAQVVLDGLARTAARGGAAGDIHSNTLIRDAAVAAGQAADGTTPDGSTPDGRLPPDVVTQHASYSDPGQGEGKPGFRPGDDAVARAQAEAAQQRAAARQTVVEQVQQAAQATPQAAAAPAPAPAAPTPAPAPPQPQA